MFASRLAETIAAAHPKQLDDLAKLVWQGMSSAALSEAEAEILAAQIQSRRDVRPAPQALREWSRPPLILPRSKPQRSPDRQRSIERRRRLAASGPMPPALAACFTTGELAVLRIIGDEVRAKGLCDRTVAELAARAGVGASTVRNAVRMAGREGLLTVQERPRPGRKNLSNLVRVISREWQAWLARGPQLRADGVPAAKTGEGRASTVTHPPFKKVHASDSRSINRPVSSVWKQEAWRKREG